MLRYVVRRVELALDFLDTGHRGAARRELAKAETALDEAARELALRADTDITSEGYQQTFRQLLKLGQQWSEVLAEAGGAPVDSAAMAHATKLARALNAGGARLVVADVAALGRPEAWRVHRPYAYHPARFLDAYRVATESLPAPATPAELAREWSLAYRAVEALTQQLPTGQAARLIELLRYWVWPGAPPAGLPALLEAELPDQVAALTWPAYAAARHHLRQIRRGPDGPVRGGPPSGPHGPTNPGGSTHAGGPTKTGGQSTSLWRSILFMLVTAPLLTLVTATEAAAAELGRPASGSGSVLVISAVTAVIVVGASFGLWKVIKAASARLRVRVNERVSRLLGIAARLLAAVLAGVLAGFVASDLAGHPMLAGLVFWGAVILTAGDLMLRLIPNVLARDLGRDWSARAPPILRLIGVGVAAGAVWWLHTSVSTGAAVWGVAAPVVAVAAVAALIRWRGALGRGVVAFARWVANEDHSAT